MKSFRCLLFVLITLTACRSDRTPVNIKGEAQGVEGVVRLSEGDSVLFAENIHKNGTFTIDGIVSAPGFFMLELFETGKGEKNEFIIYLDRDPVQISFDVSDLKKYPAISGRSMYHADISKYYSKLLPLLQAADSDYKNAKKIMGYEIEQAPDSDKVIKLKKEYRKAEERRNTVQSDVKENYIVNNPGSLLSAYLLSQSGTDIHAKPALYNDLYENLSAEVKNSKYGLQSRSLINTALKEAKSPDPN